MSTSLGRRFLGRIEWIFFVLLVAAAIGVFAYQQLVIAPAQQCEAAGNWWDPQTRTCGHVIYLPTITHRPVGARAPRQPLMRAPAG